MVSLTIGIDPTGVQTCMQHDSLIHSVFYVQLEDDGLTRFSVDNAAAAMKVMRAISELADEVASQSVPRLKTYSRYYYTLHCNKRYMTPPEGNFEPELRSSRIIWEDFRALMSRWRCKLR